MLAGQQIDAKQRSLLRLWHILSKLVAKNPTLFHFSIGRHLPADRVDCTVSAAGKESFDVPASKKKKRNSLDERCFSMQSSQHVALKGMITPAIDFGSPSYHCCRIPEDN